VVDLGSQLVGLVLAIGLVEEHLDNHLELVVLDSLEEHLGILVVPLVVVLDILKEHLGILVVPLVVDLDILVVAPGYPGCPIGGAPGYPGCPIGGCPG